jgi:hypothetical protein
MPPPEEDLPDVLLHRMRLAVGEAERAVERSATLRAARRLLRERMLLKRCAWCGRFSLGKGWQPLEQLPHFVPGLVREQATHGICPDCMHRLERGRGSPAAAD